MVTAQVLPYYIHAPNNHLLNSYYIARIFIRHFDIEINEDSQDASDLLGDIYVYDPNLNSVLSGSIEKEAVKDGPGSQK